MITPSRRADLSQKLTAFGEVIDLVKPEVAIPALKPNEAMIDLALKQASSIAVLAMFEPAITSMMPPSGSTQPAVDSIRGTGWRHQRHCCFTGQGRRVRNGLLQSVR
ncbi:hypothetical protein A0U95_11650 [Pseudomonas brassicacearum]|nr:hypothetical protein A0U95_11650 [Pseudomonas brassicacearum]